jgi:hypothetical protein
MKRSKTSKRTFSSTPAKRTQPQPPQSAGPIPSQPGTGLMGNLVGGMVMGAGVGAGSEIAHRAISGMMDKNEENVNNAPMNQTMMNNGVCSLENKNLRECLIKENNTDMNGPCRQYFEMLKMCYDANKN